VERSKRVETIPKGECQKAKISFEELRKGSLLEIITDGTGPFFLLLWLRTNGTAPGAHFTVSTSISLIVSKLKKRRGRCGL